MLLKKLELFTRALEGKIMIKLVKLIIWVAGVCAVALYLLNYFGYEINKNYFDESKAKCQQRIDECKKDLVHQGIDNAKCDFNCVNPKLIIKKK
jgi:hypothetical protein